MNTNEPRRLQPRLQRVHRLPQETGLTTGVQTNVVLGGFDPVHLLYGDEASPAAAADHETRRRRSSFDQVHQRWLWRGFGTSKSASKPLVGERLQEVIERIDLERLDGELIVGGDKDHARRFLGAEGAKHFEAIHLGHLNIEKDQAWGLGADGGDGRQAIRALADNFDFRVGGQQANQPATAYPFVVDDEYRQPRHDCR